MNFELLFDHIKPKNFLDIGAHVGDFTKKVLEKNPNCLCHMIEANPYCENFLKDIQVPYSMVALSNFKGTKDLYLEKKNRICTGASLYLENSEFYTEGSFDTVEVKTEMLDSLKIFHNELIDLIKIDVQGSELDILIGGEKTFKRTSFILLELSMVEYNWNAPLMPSVVNKLREYNFRIHEIVDSLVNRNQVLQTDFLFKNTYT
jgi:FkbM family methyltransferase